MSAAVGPNVACSRKRVASAWVGGGVAAGGGVDVVLPLPSPPPQALSTALQRRNPVTLTVAENLTTAFVPPARCSGERTMQSAVDTLCKNSQQCVACGRRSDAHRVAGRRETPARQSLRGRGLSRL